MINIHEIAAALHAKRAGAGYIARCPAHEDKTPSLSLRERDGRILLHCHAGCPQDDVIAALRERCLWPERTCNKQTRTAADGEHIRERVRDMIHAVYWSHAAFVMGEWLLEQMEPADPERRPLTYLINVIRLGNDALLAEYRSWKASHPKLTAGMVNAGRLSDAHIQRRLAGWIQGGMCGEFIP